MFTEEEIIEIEECGRRLLTPELIADYFGKSRREVVDYLEQDNPASTAYRKGKAKTVFNVQGSEVKFAELGAPAAVKNVNGYLNKTI